MKEKHYIVVNRKTRTISGYPFKDYETALKIAKSLGPDWIVEIK